MDDTAWKLLAGIFGAIVGAVIAAVINLIAATKKVQEVELSYRYKLHENYLENARKYIANVYVPINIALTELSDSYKKFRPHINLDESAAPEEAETVFSSSCKKFVEKIDDLSTRGADAFLTTQLDEKLRTFAAFINNSIGAKRPIIKMVLDYDVRIPFTGVGFSGSRNGDIRGPSRFPFVSRLSVGFFGMKLLIKQSEVLSAPISSREFETRIQSDILIIKLLIKEVTLGTHAP